MLHVQDKCHGTINTFYAVRRMLRVERSLIFKTLFDLGILALDIFGNFSKTEILYKPKGLVNTMNRLPAIHG